MPNELYKDIRHMVYTDKIDLPSDFVPAGSAPVIGIDMGSGYDVTLWGVWVNGKLIIQECKSVVTNEHKKA